MGVGGFRELRKLRHLLREGDVDLVERGGELVVVEILELEGAAEDDLSILESETGVNKQLGVDREELFVKLAVLGWATVDVSDMNPQDDERRIDPHDGGWHVGAAVNEKRARLLVDVRKLSVHLFEVGLDVLDAAHGSRVSPAGGIRAGPRGPRERVRSLEGVAAAFNPPSREPPKKGRRRGLVARKVSRVRSTAMTAEPGLAPGSIIGGLYRIRRLIGQGGMGEVYAAEGRNGTKVAVKILHERAARDPDLVARFSREANIAKQIRSPFVAAVLGAGKEKNGRLWIAFERLVGEGFDERLRREQYLSFAEVAPIIEDALQGLHAAHGAHVVHRDIKPANLFIEKRNLSPTEIAQGEHEERTRILDFGVSKMKASSNRNEPSLTAFDATLGSFAYMAPEQVRGSARVDERADLYAVGAVAFRALAGRLPFEGASALTLIALKLDRDPPSLMEVTGDTWPAAMEKFLAKIMSREREKRFGSVTEALEAWRKVCRVMGNARRRPPSQALPTPRDEQTEVTAAASFTDMGGPLEGLPPLRRR